MSEVAYWYENGVRKKAAKLHSRQFGYHKYSSTDKDGIINVNNNEVSNCLYGCGCWMGKGGCGGPVDPFGPCPNNPRKEKCTLGVFPHVSNA